jgi:hypothetical protein
MIKPPCFFNVKITKRNNMSIEEKKIKHMFGHEKPFHVPDGYFDNLTNDIMSNLPIEEVGLVNSSVVKHNRILSLRKAILAAACLLCAIFSIGTLLKSGSGDVANRAQAEHVERVSGTTNSSIYLNQAADYSMIDNEDIYAYASEN